MSKFDFAQWYKTITGLIIVIIAQYFQIKWMEVNLTELQELFTSIGNTVGAIFATYGIVMKLIRQSKNKQ